MIDWLLCKLHLCSWSVTIHQTIKVGWWPSGDIPLMLSYCPNCNRAWLTYLPAVGKKAEPRPDSAKKPNLRLTSLDSDGLSFDVEL